MVRPTVPLALLFCVTFAASAQSAQGPSTGKPSGELPSLALMPGIELPLEVGKQLFEPLGGMGGISVAVPFGRLPFLSVLTDVGYSYAPVRAQASMSMISVALGAGLNYDLTPQLILQARVGAGGFFGLFNSTIRDPTGVPYDPQSGFDPFVQAGVGISFYLTPVFSVDLSGTYYQYIGLSQGIRVQAGSSLHFSGLSRKLDLLDPRMQRVFPSLLQYYQSVPIGTATIRNGERFPLKNVQVSYFVKGLMDGPRVCATIPQMKPGESRSVDLRALFSDRILDVREDGHVAATITIDYLLNGGKQRKIVAESLSVLNRNASTWDDNRKAASFVCAKDPDVLRFGKAVAETVRAAGPDSIDLPLREGMGIFEALSQYGVGYVVDPNTPAYESASKDPLVVDFLQFPNQTLKFKGGDCDDLSILYTSLLEAVGVETAFITVPGHIYAAFALEMTAADAMKSFANDKEVLIQNGKAWVPVEITMVGKSFQEAWQAGAQEWNTNKDTAGFYPVHDAWKVYATAGTPTGIGEIQDLDRTAFAPRVGGEIARFVDRELAPQVDRLRLAMGDSYDSKLLNRLGILYARYGRMDDAEATFQKVLMKEPYVPALINMGNLALLKGDFEGAATFFQTALSKAADNAPALAGITRASYGEGKLALANQYLASLKAQDPASADKLAFMGTGDQTARAASFTDALRNVEWTESQ